MYKAIVPSSSFSITFPRKRILSSSSFPVTFSLSFFDNSSTSFWIFRSSPTTSKSSTYIKTIKWFSSSVSATPFRYLPAKIVFSVTHAVKPSWSNKSARWRYHDIPAERSPFIAFSRMTNKGSPSSSSIPVGNETTAGWITGACKNAVLTSKTHAVFPTPPFFDFFRKLDFWAR